MPFAQMAHKFTFYSNPVLMCFQDFQAGNRAQGTSFPLLLRSYLFIRIGLSGSAIPLLRIYLFNQIAFPARQVDRYRVFITRPRLFVI